MHAATQFRTRLISIMPGGMRPVWRNLFHSYTNITARLRDNE
ncbi:conserved hypothetical protein [Burkholderia pseudomallei MSHR346]|nr:conserved hypothetical protein [Burkholderia pseudomallei MSHR346]